MWTDEQIKGKILHKLTRMGKFEHSHTALEHLHKSFPPQMKGRAKDRQRSLPGKASCTSRGPATGSRSPSMPP